MAVFGGRYSAAFNKNTHERHLSVVNRVIFINFTKKKTRVCKLIIFQNSAQDTTLRRKNILSCHQTCVDSVETFFFFFFCRWSFFTFNLSFLNLAIDWVLQFKLPCRVIDKGHFVYERFLKHSHPSSKRDLITLLIWFGHNFISCFN